ncbi:MAG: hypothetical protein K2W94_01555 [Alphaproteobacteria bacterium]|nr:hypothetical protein [Alphaproteobacteria bacterium]
MSKQRTILGIVCFNHDASACIINKNKLVAFAEEERFNYDKHTSKFPLKAIEYCLNAAELKKDDITDIAFYFNMKKCLIQYLIKNNPLAILYNFEVFKRKRFFYEALWLTNFYFSVSSSIERLFDKRNVKVHFMTHHECHAWYGIYASELKNGVVLSNDSMGEGISTLGMVFNLSNSETKPKILLTQNDPHSIGYLYGAVTEFLGYKRVDGEGKVMALASFGTDKYLEYFEKNIIFKEKGGFKINKNFIIDRSFKPGKEQRLTNSFYERFGNPRDNDEELNQHHFDIAYGLQKITEKILDHQVKYLSQFSSSIILTGGVAQNSVANGILSCKYPSIKFVVPPIPHDAGCSIGAAVSLHRKLYKSLPEYTETAFLGEEFHNEEIIKILDNNKINYKVEDNIVDFMVNELSKERVIAVFRKQMEGGPRALCHRSIIADPSVKGMLDHLNKNVKYREYFRPYGGFIRSEDVTNLFDFENEHIEAPYMSFVYRVKSKWENKISSLVHVDKTCRIQIVPPNGDPMLLALLKKYNERNGIPILINTSFNVRSLPICRTPQDALNAFYGSQLDTLIFNDKIIVQK